MASATLTAVSVRALAAVAALLGGVAWVAFYFLDVEPLPWVGGILLLVATAAVGASLVRHPAIKVVAGLGAVLLAASVFSLPYNAVDDGTVVMLVTGGLAALLVAVHVVRDISGGNH